MQYTDTTIEIIGISFGSSGNYSSVGSAEITANPGNLGSSIYFQLAVELGSSDFIKVRDPFDSDFMGFKQAEITRITGEDTGEKIFVVSDGDYGDGFEKGMMVRHANISGGVGTVKQSFDGEKGFSFTTEETSVAVSDVLKFYSKNNSGLKKLFDTERLCLVPEFLREVHAYEDFTKNHNVLIIGANNDECIDVVKKCHGDYPKNILILKPEEAEFVKYFSNVFNTIICK